MENAIQNGKTRAVLPRHPQGGHQQLGLQGHDYRAPICFSSVNTWPGSCYATSKMRYIVMLLCNTYLNTKYFT